MGTAERWLFSFLFGWRGWGAVYAKCNFCSEVQWRKRDVSEMPRTVQTICAVWGGVGGGNTRLSCCRSLFISSVSVFGEPETADPYKQSKRSTEKSSDLKDEPAPPLRRCERSWGPGHVLLKSLCSQMNFQIIWVPEAESNCIRAAVHEEQPGPAQGPRAELWGWWWLEMQPLALGQPRIPRSHPTLHQVKCAGLGCWRTQLTCFASSWRGQRENCC